jgi:mannose-1-phosphate guanylyltransferase
VLLGLTNILLKAPEAIVVMTPSDHGVTSRTIFLAGIRMAGQAVKCGMSSVVLFGVEPDHACSDYGWIVPSSGESPRHLGAVTGFVEKPNATVATRLLDQGAVWNTMVLVARVSSLVQLFSRHLPDLASTFDAACGLPAAERDRFLETAYAEMPRADFSHDLLSRANGLSLMVWPKAMGWSDLGTPDRLIEWETRRRTPRSHETPQPAAHAQCA